MTDKDALPAGQLTPAQVSRLRSSGTNHDMFKAGFDEEHKRIPVSAKRYEYAKATVKRKAKTPDEYEAGIQSVAKNLPY